MGKGIYVCLGLYCCYIERDEIGRERERKDVWDFSYRHVT